MSSVKHSPVHIVTKIGEAILNLLYGCTILIGSEAYNILHDKYSRSKIVDVRCELFEQAVARIVLGH